MAFETTFKAQVVDHTGEGTLTDGSVMCEVLGGDDRLASCTDLASAQDLANRLNQCITKWRDENSSDRTVDA